MTARTLTARGRCWAPFLLTVAPLLAGCQGLASRHAANKIPHYGVIDPHQPRELQMVSLPPYVVEPPDELEVSIRPAFSDLSLSSLTVQSDGTVDLGFAGDVYVAGLTLAQVEEKIGQHLDRLEATRKPSTPYKVSVRLANGSASKFYYVLGTVTTQGRFPISGNDTVLDAIVAAGLRTNSLPEKAYLVRPHASGGPDQILKIDWCGIKDRGDNLTNYQVFPGDRIIVPGGKPPSLISTLLGGG